MQKQILFIVTSAMKMGPAGKATGIWAEELAVPYYALVDAGYTVALASTKGGQAPFDPGSIKATGQNHPTVERFLSDANALHELEQTLSIASVTSSQYDAIFFPGGHGTMWDLPHSTGVTKVVEQAFSAGKLIASVCHGAAGLVSAKRTDGQSILQGKRVNSFTNAEENAAGLMSIVPFALESKIRELGGLFESAPNWQAFVIRDGNLITGQNPQSSLLVAEHLLNALAA